MLLKKVYDLLRKPFIRNVAVLVTGTAAAQIIGLVSSPIITRLYGPEAFGVMGVFMAIIQVLSPIATMAYPIAIVLPKSDKNAKRIIKLSLYISISVALIAALILLFFGEKIVSFFQLESISSYMFLIPFVIIFSGLLQISEQWLIRTKKFIINSKVAFLQSFIINGSKIGFGFISPSVSVLVFLTAISDGLRASMMMFFDRRSKARYRESTNTEEELSIKELAIKYRDFPLFRAPEILTNAVSQRLPVLMLTSFFGAAAAGFYTLANTVLQKPIQLIGKSVGDVFYPRITQAAHNKEKLTNLIIKATLMLGAVGIFPFAIIIFFGPMIFSFVFGVEWNVAGKYAQWLGIFLFFEFINKPSIKALPVLKAQRFHLIYSILTSVIRFAALAIGYFVFSDDLIAIALFGISSAILHIIIILIVLLKSRSYDKNNL